MFNWLRNLFASGMARTPESLKAQKKANGGTPIVTVYSPVRGDARMVTVPAAHGCDASTTPLPDELKTLLAALNDEDQGKRSHAIDKLRLLGDARAEGPLTKILENDTERQPVYYAILALAAIGTSTAIWTLISALERRKGDLGTIAMTLGDRRAKGATDALIRLLKDGTEYQRRHAVMALGKIGDPKAIPPLKNALNDPDEGVRERAEEALRTLVPPSTAQESSTEYPPNSDRAIITFNNNTEGRYMKRLLDVILTTYRDKPFGYSDLPTPDPDLVLRLRRLSEQEAKSLGMTLSCMAGDDVMFQSFCLSQLTKAGLIHTVGAYKFALTAQGQRIAGAELV